MDENPYKATKPRWRLRFSIRDILWLTVAAALMAGWWVDRSELVWRNSESVATMDRLRARLDRTDPGWRTQEDSLRVLMRFDTPARPEGGYIFGSILFGLAALIVVLVWRGQLHVSMLERRH